MGEPQEITFYFDKYTASWWDELLTCRGEHHMDTGSTELTTTAIGGGSEVTTAAQDVLQLILCSHDSI